MSVARTHHRFSLTDYEQMIDRGILTESDRVELIRGEIIDKMSIGDLHAAAVLLLTSLFHRSVLNVALVSVQNPVVFDDSQPEPDVVLLKSRGDWYAGGKPRADDVLLLVEVADSTLDFDRYEKCSLYAESGIAEYWILNLLDRTLEVHRQPQSGGQYAYVRSFTASDAVDLTKLPGMTFTVGELFPPVMQS